MPILANVLLAAKGGKLSITATDLEVELVATSEVDVQRAGEITRSRPQAAGYLSCVAGRRRDHADARRRAHDRPRPEEPLHAVDIAGSGISDGRGDQRRADARGCRRRNCKRLLDKTHFSMAQQDVRYYLNGMLLETSAKLLRSVATDGHRLALCEIDLPSRRQAGPAGHHAAQRRARAAADPRARRR